MCIDIWAWYPSSLVGPVFHGSLASIQKILFCDKNKKKIKKNWTDRTLICIWTSSWLTILISQNFQLFNLIFFPELSLFTYRSKINQMVHVLGTFCLWAFYLTNGPTDHRMILPINYLIKHSQHRLVNHDLWFNQLVDNLISINHNTA